MEGIMNSINQELQQIRKQKESLETQLTELIRKETALVESLKYFEKQMETISTPKPKTENPETSEKKPILTSTPIKKQKEVINIEEEAEEDFQQQRSGKKKWYVIFNGPFRGIYTDWSIASHHITGQNVTHKSYPTKEAAKQAFDEAYKTVATEKVQTSKAFTTLNQSHLEKLTKLNSMNLIKNLPTSLEKEIGKKPTPEKFQQCWDNLVNYTEAHTTLLFYPKNRAIGPKAIFFPGAEPELIQKYFIHGFIDSLYINGTTLREIQELPSKIQNIVRHYNDTFAHQRTIFLRFHSSYPIFNKEQQLLIPSIFIAQLGVSNGNHPPKDIIERKTPSIEQLAISLSGVFFGSLKIGTGRGQKKEVRINYKSEEMVIYSKSNEIIDDRQQAILSEFEEPFEHFTGILAALPEDCKIHLCKQINKVQRHSCMYCQNSQDMDDEEGLEAGSKQSSSSN